MKGSDCCVLVVFSAISSYFLASAQLMNPSIGHEHPNPLFEMFDRAKRSLSPAEYGDPRCKSDYGDGTCVVFSRCGSYYQILTSNPAFQCKLGSGRTGYCCPHANPNYIRNKVGAFSGPVMRTNKIDRFGYNDIEQADREVSVMLKDLEKKEQQWTTRGFFESESSPVGLHAKLFASQGKTNEDGLKAFAAILSAKKLAKRFQLSREEAFDLHQFRVREDLGVCRGDIVCDRNAIYRRFDGSCTNLKFPLWGQTSTPFFRLVRPAYEDGVWDPVMTSVTGEKLPGARKVSSKLEPEKNLPLNGVTALTQAFGQFIDHDIASGAIFGGPNDAPIRCCTPENKFFTNPDDVHPACLPIEVPKDDPFYSQHGVECMGFVRGLPSPTMDCTYGFAQQVNQINHVLDASQVYGNNEEIAKSLRGKNGKMLVTQIPGWSETLLPQNKDPEDSCADKAKGHFCFLAGDHRVNLQVGLTIVHTLFVREHNRLVDELSGLNPHWDGEKLYQETRRLVAAIIQHILYNEYLPLVISPRAMYERGITPLSEGYFRDYDPSINPSASAEIDIAFRFGHSTVQGRHAMINERYNDVGGLSVRTFLLKPLALYKSERILEEFLRGMLHQKAQSADTSFSEDLQHHLFDQGKPFGLDLPALNIQRSRDFGLQSYNDYREFCKLERVKHFDGLRESMTPEQIRILKSVYKHVDDIDFFVGGMSEIPAPGAMVGPTFLCIMADQFARSKKGDRFFHDHEGQPHPFTPPQLREIRKATFARVICDNVREMKRLQPLVFYEESNVNTIVPCDDEFQIPKMDLRHWKK